MLTRRELLLSAAVARAAMAQTGAPAPPAVLNPNRLTKFVDPLPLPRLAAPLGTRPDPVRADARIPFYRLTMREVATRFHRDLPPARVWGYENSSPGPVIEARSGQPILVEWVNALPARHLFAIDHTLHGAGAGVPDVRAVVHVHGARVPPAGDGYPESWYTPGQSATTYYPNGQAAAPLWYHDHAMAITRLNFYAGLFGFYLIRDAAEDRLHLPSGEYEIPLMLYDRSLTAGGQLYYPVSPDPAQPWVGDFAGEAVLANGKLYPYLEVRPRPYRLRVANASNGRFLNLAFRDGARFLQLGSDQGLLSAPVELTELTLAPAERADLIVDFAGRGGGTTVLASDSYDILQFRVSAADGNEPGRFVPPRLPAVPRTDPAEAVRTRELTIDGTDDMDGGITMAIPMTLNGSWWHDPVTEKPVLDTVEIWNLVNLTDDVHPIHLHLVRFQILDRRPFHVFAYRTEGRLDYTADAIPPHPGEAGWKDTVRANPGMVTRIIVRFEGYAGRYVWHCHILEHEDNEMMRPYDVLPA
jgi:spore coat protein A